MFNSFVFPQAADRFASCIRCLPMACLTSFSVVGDYAIDEAAGDGEADQPKVIKLTHGFSKDHRPDVKQAVLSLATAGGCGAPLWMAPYDGNPTDKKTLRETIERVETFRREIDCSGPTRWIADSSLYTAENWVKMRHVRWVSRAPETLSEAKALIGEPADAIALIAQHTAGGAVAFPPYASAPRQHLRLLVLQDRTIRTLRPR